MVSGGRTPAAALGARALENTPEQWDSVAGALDHPFLQLDWLSAWWDAFHGSLDEPQLLTRYEGDRLIEGLPLARRGSELRALANVHTPISGVVRMSGPRALDAPELDGSARTLMWPALQHAEAVELAAALRSDGWVTLVEPQHRSPVVDFEQSPGSYLPSLGRSTRQRARRMTRKLIGLGAEFRLAEPNLDRDLFERCLRLEAAGWKGRNGTAVLSHGSTSRFYRAVSRLPQARLSLIEGPDGLLAFALCLAHASRLFLLKTSYDERAGALAPGFALQHALVEQCDSLGLRSYELLGSGDPWKLHFANSSRPISRLVAYRRGPVGRARWALRSGRSLGKRLLRALP